MWRFSNNKKSLVRLIILFLFYFLFFLLSVSYDFSDLNFYSFSYPFLLLSTFIYFFFSVFSRGSFIASDVTFCWQQPIFCEIQQTAQVSLSKLNGYLIEELCNLFYLFPLLVAETKLYRHTDNESPKNKSFFFFYIIIIFYFFNSTPSSKTLFPPLFHLEEKNKIPKPK